MTSTCSWQSAPKNGENTLLIRGTPTTAWLDEGGWWIEIREPRLAADLARELVYALRSAHPGPIALTIPAREAGALQEALDDALSGQPSPLPAAVAQAVDRAAEPLMVGDGELSRLIARVHVGLRLVREEKGARRWWFPEAAALREAGFQLQRAALQDSPLTPHHGIVLRFRLDGGVLLPPPRAASAGPDSPWRLEDAPPAGSQ